jgi:ABC-type sugar transport system permease subunit
MLSQPALWATLDVICGPDSLASSVYLQTGVRAGSWGYAATVALFLFVLIAVLSVLQYQVLRTRQT